MQRRDAPGAARAALAVAIVSLAAGGAAGQGPGGQSDVPRTPWGHPDLQGVWSHTTTVPLERLAAPGESPAAAEAEAAGAAPLVVDTADGRLPPLTARGRQRADAGAHEFPDGNVPVASWQELSLFDRCITRGLPGAMSPGVYNHKYQIMQTPTHVVLIVGMIRDSRIIPVDGRPPLGDGIRQWLGDSRGHWDGDTLVVETRNFSRKTNTRMPTVFGGSESLRLVERFTRVDADTLDYRFTFEDPAEFTQPWTAAITLTRGEGAVLEHACHEGNYAPEGEVITGSGVTEERTAAENGAR